MATAPTAPVSPKDEVLKKVEDLTSTNQKIVGALEKLTDAANVADEKARRNPFGIRKGEDPLSSRGYSYTKLIRVLNKQLTPDQAKVEVEISNRLQDLYVDKYGYQKAEANSILVPLSADLMIQNDPSEEKFAQEIREVVKAGVQGGDPYEAAKIARSVNKTLSWNNGPLSDFVAPPMFGELIDLLRNNEVFLAAGARHIAMPPNGRIVYPRHTGPASAYWVGESTEITASEPDSGDLTLTAKKLAARVSVPNELFRFSSISLEMFLRDDIMKVASLKLDSALLQGVGSTTSPKGIINYANINTHTASSVGTDGNLFQPEDVALMIGKVEEQNATFRGFAMRPLMYTALVNRRADGPAPGDGKGQFVFNFLRGLGDEQHVDRMTAASLYGYPAWKSTNISNTRDKGAATNLTYILGGDFTDYVVAMSSVMEFAISTQGDEPFKKDQTWIRGIMMVDGAPRREKSFILCDDLVVG